MWGVAEERVATCKTSPVIDCLNNWWHLSLQKPVFTERFLLSLPLSLYMLFVSSPAAFWVTRITPRQVTFNFPASPKQVIYQVVKMTPGRQRQTVGNYSSSTIASKQTYPVEPGTTYRFQVRAIEDSTKQPSLFSSPVDISVPGRFCFKE